MGAFENRIECAYCREHDLQPPEGGSFRKDWKTHLAEHIVDKLEPSYPEGYLERSRVASSSAGLGVTTQSLSQTTFEDVFEGIFQEALSLLIERQRKYGKENIQRLGLWGVFDRLSSDKVERVRRAFSGTLTRGVLEVELGDDYSDESFEDALLDIANYALIMIALKRGQWGKPLREEVDAE